MSNFLDNGAVLPHGLLGESDAASMAGFNKTYRNYPLRIGVVVQSYPISDINNHSKLSNEYDVSVIEQHEDLGATTIVYKNCMKAEGFGSIPDFFEYTLRPLQVKTSKGVAINLNQQNGAIVLLLCLDGMSDKGIIISNLTHPDRPTTITDQGPYLQGEFNGCNIVVNEDGSASFTFKGATDNDGNQVDASQGNTVFSVEKDGSFQFNHDSITFRLDRNGTVTLTAKKDINVNANGNINFVIQGNANIQCTDSTVTASGTATVEGQTVKLGQAATEAVIKGDTFKKLFDAHIHPTTTGPSGPPTMPLSPSALSKKVKTE